MSRKMPASRTEEIVVQESNDEFLVYDLRTNKALFLNATSSEIWKRCDGKSTVKETAAIIGKRLNTAIGEDLIWLAINDLEENDLLKEKAEPPIPFSKLSRRDVLYKYLLPALIFPAIVSVLAPKAAYAQSGCLTSGTTIGGPLPPGTCTAALGNPPVPNVACCSGFTQTVGIPGGPCHTECT